MNVLKLFYEAFAELAMEILLITILDIMKFAVIFALILVMFVLIAMLMGIVPWFRDQEWYKSIASALMSPLYLICKLLGV